MSLDSNHIGFSTIKARYIKENGIKKWILNYGHEVSFAEDLSLYEVVDWMLRLKSRGFSEYFTKFQGHCLYVFDITLDGAFMEVYGKTYEECLKEGNLVLKK